MPRIRVKSGWGPISLDLGGKGLHLLPGQERELSADDAAKPRIVNLVRIGAAALIPDKPSPPAGEKPEKKGAKDHG